MKAEGKTTNGKWPEVTLGEVFDISSSKRVLEAQWKTAGVPFYRAREIVKLAKEGSVQNGLFISEELFSEYKTKYGVPKPGDLMISAVGTLGACYVVQPSDRFYYKDASVLRFSPKQPLCSRFIHHAFRTNQILDQVHAGSGSTVGTYTISRAHETRMPLPPLTEQRRIAEVLDRTEALRAKRRAALAQLDSLTQSLFLDLFGDPKSNPEAWPLKAMTEMFTTSPIFGSMIPPVTEKCGWLSLRVGNIQNWTLDLSDSKYVDLPASSVERHSVRDGDLLLARAIASIDHLGKCVIAHPNGEKWAFDSHLMRLRFDHKRTEPEFIRHLFMTPGGRLLFLKASRKSTVQFNINTREVSALQIPVPPISLQREFARRVTTVEKLKAAQRASLAELDALFASLQHRAFRGEL